MMIRLAIALCLSLTLHGVVWAGLLDKLTGRTSYLVTDSGYWVRYPTDVYWIDNNRIIFVGASNDERNAHIAAINSDKPHVEKVYIWDTRGNAISTYAPISRYGGVCFSRGHINFVTEATEKEIVWREGTNRLAMMSALDRLQGEENTAFTGTIHFTGQSLGGALAQYAAYDYAKSKANAFDPTKITLTTFNGLGALDGIEEMYGSPDAALMAGVSTRHYVTGNDIVHRLGGGHINGGNTLLLDFKTWSDGTPILDEFNSEVGMSAGGWRYPNLFDAHRIETGFYRWFEELGTDFSYAQPHSIDYIGEEAVRAVGASFANALNDNDHSSAESILRTYAAVASALALAEPEGIREATIEIIKHLRATSVNAEGFIWDVLEWGVPRAYESAANTPESKGVLLAAATVALAVAGAIDAGESFVAFLAKVRAAIPESIVPLDDGMLAALTGAESEGEAAFKAAVAVALLADELPGKPGLLSGLDIDISGLVNALKGDDWQGKTIAYVAELGAEQGTDVGELFAGLGSGLLQLLNGLGGGPGGASMIERLGEAIGDAVADVAKAIANGFEERIKAFADTAIGWASDVTRGLLDDLVEAMRPLADGGTTPEGFTDAFEAIRDTAQTIVLSADRTGNPFQGGGEIETDGIAQGDLKEGRAKSYTLYLPYAVGEDGQTIRLKITGGETDKLVALYAGRQIDLGGGEFEIEVRAGAREVSFGLWAKEDTDSDAALQIEAQLLDAEGQASHKQHLEARLQLDADSEDDPEYDRVIRGDLEPEDTDETAEGIQMRFDDLGNPVFTQDPKPGREDIFYDSVGRDDIQSKEGKDTIEALAGGDDKIDAGGGDDLVQSGTGSDEVAGGAGKDIVVGGADDDDLYGGEFKTYADVLTEADGAGGGSEKGDWVDGGEGDDLVAGAAQADGLTGGAGDDIIAGGDGDDTLFGDRALLELGRDWRLERAVEKTADKTTYKTTLQGGDLEETGTGDDVLLGGGGDDWLFAGAGDDYIEGGAGNDVGFGDGGCEMFLAIPSQRHGRMPRKSRRGRDGARVVEAACRSAPAKIAIVGAGGTASNSSWMRVA